MAGRNGGRSRHGPAASGVIACAICLLALNAATSDAMGGPHHRGLRQFGTLRNATESVLGLRPPSPAVGKNATLPPPAKQPSTLLPGTGKNATGLLGGASAPERNATGPAGLGPTTAPKPGAGKNASTTLPEVPPPKPAPGKGVSSGVLGALSNATRPATTAAGTLANATRPGNIAGAALNATGLRGLRQLGSSLLNTSALGSLPGAGLVNETASAAGGLYNRTTGAIGGAYNATTGAAGGLLNATGLRGLLSDKDKGDSGSGRNYTGKGYNSTKGDDDDDELPSTSVAVAALRAANISVPANSTIFTPSDKAFRRLAKLLGVNDTSALLGPSLLNTSLSVLLYHVVPGKALPASYFTNRTNTTLFTALPGTNLTVYSKESKVYVLDATGQKARVLVADLPLPGTNSLLHVINRVLRPL